MATTSNPASFSLDFRQHDLGLVSMEPLKTIRWFENGEIFKCVNSKGEVFCMKIVLSSYLQNPEIVYVNYLTNKYSRDTIVKSYKTYINKQINVYRLFKYFGIKVDPKEADNIHTDDTYDIILLEFCSLSDMDRLHEARLLSKQGPVNDDEYRALLFIILHTLKELQEQFKVMHCDLHPGNVVVTSCDEVFNAEIDGIEFSFKHKYKPKITDFERGMIFHEELTKTYEHHSPMVDEFSEKFDHCAFLTGMFFTQKLPLKTKQFIRRLSRTIPELIEEDDINILFDNIEIINHRYPNITTLMKDPYFDNLRKTG